MLLNYLKYCLEKLALNYEAKEFKKSIMFINHLLSLQLFVMFIYSMAKHRISLVIRVYAYTMQYKIYKIIENYFFRNSAQNFVENSFRPTAAVKMSSEVFVLSD